MPSGRLSGPILNPGRCFFGRDVAASSSTGLLGAMNVFVWDAEERQIFHGPFNADIICCMAVAGPEKTLARKYPGRRGSGGS